MKKTIIGSTLLVLAWVVPLGIGLEASYWDGLTHRAAIQYGQKRPFSFYYPYSYKYYYPRPEYHQSSYACYWLYTNGTYVYTCQ